MKINDILGINCGEITCSNIEDGSGIITMCKYLRNAPPNIRKCLLFNVELKQNSNNRSLRCNKCLNLNVDPVRSLDSIVIEPLQAIIQDTIKVRDSRSDTASYLVADGYLFAYNKILELILNYKNYISNESTSK